MVWIPGGRFEMGSDGPHASAFERPVHTIGVDGFFMDRHTVTNREFRAFVDATGYATVAERPLADQLAPGSLVFSPRDDVTELSDWSQWWRFAAGADWRHPDGPESSIDGRDDHPVVQVAWPDAVAYAEWAGRRLPTEAEWEFAARGGLEGAEFAWGDAPLDAAHPQAHIYEGTFPTHAAGPRPVGGFAPNAYGLSDMSGNVWEWTGDWFRPDTYAAYLSRGVVHNPTGPAQGLTEGGAEPTRVLRGGSFLCSDTYCRGYRVSARSPAPPDSGASHIGFRTVMTADQWRTLARSER
jgi:formylglycine-generating enzyme required for sulfatase activity